MSTQLTIEDAVKEAFIFLDPGLTGFIDKTKLQKLLHNLQMDVSEDEVSKFIIAINSKSVTNHLTSLNVQLDQNEKSEFEKSIEKSGGVTFQSFSELLQTPLDKDEGEKWAMEEFKLIDREGKGFISEADVTSHMMCLGAKVENFSVIKMMENIGGVCTLPQFIQIFKDLNKKMGTKEPAKQHHEN